MTDHPQYPTATEIAAFAKENPRTTFGGLGGLSDGRAIDAGDLFEAAVNRCLGDAIRADDAVAREMWCALSNMDWQHANGDTAGYSFRAAGDLVAAIRGKGNYMDWYCCGRDGIVSVRIADAMAKEGWTPEDIEWQDAIMLSGLDDAINAVMATADAECKKADIDLRALMADQPKPIPVSGVINHGWRNDGPS